MQEQWRKIQLYDLWQESNLDPAIPVQRSNQLIYYSVQSPVVELLKGYSYIFFYYFIWKNF
jgi:hypothetical protein